MKRTKLCPGCGPRRFATCLTFLLIMSCIPVVGQDSLTWKRTGGPLGGLGYDVRMRPDNPDVMYVTDAFAGVFRSADGGRTWYPSNKGITARNGASLDAIPVFSLTVDPNNYDIIWAGTQDIRGIYKSTDAGDTWTRLDNGIEEMEGITFRGFTIDPRTSDIVYAAGEIASYAWSDDVQIGREFDMTKGVVYKTTDGGQNWNAVWRGDNLARYVWIDPSDPEILYVSTGIFDREAANSDPVAGSPGGVGIIKSTDGGQTWREINNGLDNLYVGTLFMHPENPDILLAGTGNNQYADGEGVYLTTDGGASWQRTLSTGIQSVEFSMSDPDIAYAGNPESVYRSEDGGLTWQLMVGGGGIGWGSLGVRAGFPIDFQVDWSDPDRIFVNNYGGGNFLSEDGGRTWMAASEGYTGAQTRDVAVDATNPARVYAAARSGAFVSQDGGHVWHGRSNPPAASLEWYAVAIDPETPSHVLASSNWHGVVLESHDDGGTWRNASEYLGENISFRRIVFAPSNRDVVYAGTSAFYSAGTFDDGIPAAGIYVSLDRGESWRPANDETSADANVTDLAVHPESPDVIYAATGNHGVLKSMDGGSSWTEMNSGLPVSPFRALSVAVFPTNPDIVFVGLDFHGLYRSVDAGANWDQIEDGLTPEATISAIALGLGDPPTVFIADRITGVYRSPDPPEAPFVLMSEGLRNRNVNRLAFSSDGLHLYAATEGEGVYRLDLNGQSPGSPTSVAPDEGPIAAFRLEQNYPNPFKPETVFRFTLREAGYVRLDVLDILGRNVATIVDERRSAGPHEVRWRGLDRNGVPLAGGAYIYRLEAGGFADAKSLILIR